MKVHIAAAFALTAATSLHAQTATGPPLADLSTASAADGAWTYSAMPDGSEARFANASSLPQLTLHCTRSTRRVTISKPATGAAPFLNIWTSAQSRSVPASFDPATRRIRAQLGASDPLLDAIVFSRGRVGFAVSGQPALVVPTWAEPARVVEDCRA